MMLKNILLLIGLSIVAIFFQDQLLGVLHFLTKMHDQIAAGLGSVFSLNSAGEIVQSVLALLLVPAVVAALIAVAHFFIKQEHFPHTLHVVWVTWAVFLVAILSQSGHVTNQSAQEIQSAKQIVQDAQELRAQKEALAAKEAAKGRKKA